MRVYEDDLNKNYKLSTPLLSPEDEIHHGRRLAVARYEFITTFVHTPDLVHRLAGIASSTAANQRGVSLHNTNKLSAALLAQHAHTCAREPTEANRVELVQYIDEHRSAVDYLFRACYQTALNGLKTAHDNYAQVRELFVDHNQRLVIECAKKRIYRDRRHRDHCDYSLDELITFGNVGLLLAVDHFDIERKQKIGRFSTFAMHYITCYIDRAVDQTRSVPKRYHLAHQCSLYSQTPEGVPLLACIEDWRSTNEEYTRDTAERFDQILALLRRLPARERTRDQTILFLRFGICCEEPLTLEKIGRELGLTRERIRQLQNNAIKRIREKIKQRITKYGKA